MYGPFLLQGPSEFNGPGGSLGTALLPSAGDGFFFLSIVYWRPGSTCSRSSSTVIMKWAALSTFSSASIHSFVVAFSTSSGVGLQNISAVGSTSGAHSFSVFIPAALVIAYSQHSSAHSASGLGIVVLL